MIWQICGKNRKHQVLLSLVESDAPKSSIIFVSEQVCIHISFPIYCICYLLVSNEKKWEDFSIKLMSICYLRMQSEKSKKAGNAPSTTLLVDFLKASHLVCSDIHLLEEDTNFNLRAASLSVSEVQFHYEFERWFFLSLRG